MGPRNHFNAGMKIAFLLALSLVSVGCTSLELRRQDTAHLKARFFAIEKDLASYHTGETNQITLNRFRRLIDEEQGIERELFRRCEAGDQAACLPYFHLIAPDISD